MKESDAAKTRRQRAALIRDRGDRCTILTPLLQPFEVGACVDFTTFAPSWRYLWQRIVWIFKNRKWSQKTTRSIVTGIDGYEVELTDGGG